MTVHNEPISDGVLPSPPGGDAPEPSACSSQISPRVPPNPQVSWEPLVPATNIDDVVRNLDQIIDWAIREQSTIGYFPVMYKRSTVTIREALGKGSFRDRPLMEDFAVRFAQRYFNALNAYFSPVDYPGEYNGLTLPWEVVFVGHELGYSTMLQHMVAGLNAHIQFDLGVVTAEVVPSTIDTFEHDFNLINELVVSQVNKMLKVVYGLSPTLRWTRWLIPAPLVIARVLRKFRKSCWSYATYLMEHRDKFRIQTVNQMSWTAAQCAWYLHPPEYWRVTPTAIKAIARFESRDTGANLQALNRT